MDPGMPEAPAAALPGAALPAVDPACRRRAVLMILGAAGIFSVAGALVKGLGGQGPLAQVVLCRNLFAIPALLALLWQAGGLAALRSRHPGLHAARLAGGLLGMVGAFYGYAVLPLATVTALGFTMPLFLTLLSVPLLQERGGAAPPGGGGGGRRRGV